MREPYTGESTKEHLKVKESTMFHHAECSNSANRWRGLCSFLQQVIM